MGWSIKLTADKEIAENDIDEIVNSDKYNYNDRFTSKQSWGWSTRVDIHKPEKNILRISGAYFSVELGEPAAENIKKLLEDKGYAIKRSKLKY